MPDVAETRNLVEFAGAKTSDPFAFIAEDHLSIVSELETGGAPGNKRRLLEEAIVQACENGRPGYIKYVVDESISGPINNTWEYARFLMDELQGRTIRAFDQVATFAQAKGLQGFQDLSDLREPTFSEGGNGAWDMVRLAAVVLPASVKTAQHEAVDPIARVNYNVDRNLVDQNLVDNVVRVLRKRKQVPA